MITTDLKPMKTETDKFTTMIGFAKRAGKIVYGYDNLKTKAGSRVKLLAVGGNASDNLVDGMKKLAVKLDKPLIRANNLEDVVGNNVKALGITDVNMADAICKFVSETQSEYYKSEYGLRR